MNLVPWRRKTEPSGQVEERAGSDLALSLAGFYDQLVQFGYQGNTYTLPGSSQEEPSGQFVSMANAAYKTNPVVAACMNFRMEVFAQAKFKFRDVTATGQGRLFGTGALTTLDNPWPGGTTGDLLAKCIQYADLGGNAYIAKVGQWLQVLRPDWVDIVIGGSPGSKVGAWDVGSQVIGYVYYPGGKHNGKTPVIFDVSEVAHFAPLPDPLAQFRGMSWLTPVVRDVMSDKAATDHKLAFLENAATPNMVIKFDVPDIEKFKAYSSLFREQYEGVANRGRTMFLASGMDSTVVGANMQQLDFTSLQGAGEVRICMAAGTPAVLIGALEGLQGSSLNTGNYQAAQRRFADVTMAHLWGEICGALQTIVPAPPRSELWYDGAGIPFLRADAKDAAEIQEMQSRTIRSLVDAGFEPESIKAAVISNDYSKLTHTGFYSVQLQQLGAGADSPGDQPAVAPAASGSNSERALKDIDQMFRALLPQEAETGGI